MTNIIKQLGPIVEVDVKLKLPSAFVEYINEVAIKQNNEAKDLDEYCNEVLLGMITHLDGSQDIFPNVFHSSYPKCTAGRNLPSIEHLIEDTMTMR